MLEVSVCMFTVWLSICKVHTINILSKRDNKMIICQEKSLVPTNNIKHVWYLSLRNRFYKSVENRPFFLFKKSVAVHTEHISPTDLYIGGCRWLSVGFVVWCELSLCPTKRFPHRPKNRPTFPDQKYRPILSPIFFQVVGEFCRWKSVETHRFGCHTKRFAHRQKYKNRWVLMT